MGVLVVHSWVGIVIVGANLGVTVGSSWLVPGYLHQENLGMPSAHTYLRLVYLLKCWTKINFDLKSIELSKMHLRGKPPPSSPT